MSMLWVSRRGRRLSQLEALRPFILSVATLRMWMVPRLASLFCFFTITIAHDIVHRFAASSASRVFVFILGGVSSFVGFLSGVS